MIVFIPKGEKVTFCCNSICLCLAMYLFYGFFVSESSNLLSLNGVVSTIKPSEKLDMIKNLNLPDSTTYPVKSHKMVSEEGSARRPYHYLMEVKRLFLKDLRLKCIQPK